MRYAPRTGCSRKTAHIYSICGTNQGYGVGGKVSDPYKISDSVT